MTPTVWFVLLLLLLLLLIIPNFYFLILFSLFSRVPFRASTAT